MDKKIALYNSHSVVQIKNYFKDTDIDICEINKPEDAAGYNIAVFYDYNDKISGDILQSTTCLNIHPSLLPAFEGEKAAEKAFFAGVKVSGITVSEVNTDRIIAQYPVLIGIDTHIDDFLKEIIHLENILVPVVLDSIINDRVFDYQSLFQQSCDCKNRCKNCN